MEEIDATKRTGHNWIEWMAGTTQIDLGRSADMRENTTFAEFNQGELGVV